MAGNQSDARSRAETAYNSAKNNPAADPKDVKTLKTAFDAAKATEDAARRAGGDRR